MICLVLERGMRVTLHLRLIRELFQPLAIFVSLPCSSCKAYGTLYGLFRVDRVPFKLILWLIPGMEPNIGFLYSVSLIIIVSCFSTVLLVRVYLEDSKFEIVILCDMLNLLRAGFGMNVFSSRHSSGVDGAVEKIDGIRSAKLLKREYFV